MQIPAEWALDPDGRPTTDPNVALKGTMAPTGGYKGVGMALLVEIMAAAMTGATLGVHASPFSGTKGGPPKTGQFFLAINPETTSGGDFAERLGSLLGAMRDQIGAHIPGDGRRSSGRLAADAGINVNPAILAKINSGLK
jgi:(2R)-3-sulfolactate dehydrogenase (NADP+)